MPDKKHQLKLILLKRAHEELKKEKKREEANRAATVKDRLFECPDLNALSEEELKEFIRKVHAACEVSDEKRYDLEVRTERNQKDMDEMLARIKDMMGKNKQPPLRRVKMSADQMLKALLGNKHKVALKK